MLNIQEKLQEKFHNACKSGNMDIIKHLLETPSLSKNVDLANPSVAFKALEIACAGCNEELIDYIISQPEMSKLKTNMGDLKFVQFNNVSDVFSDVFSTFCYKAELEKIHFMFDREKYREYLNFEYKNGRCIRVAYENSNHEVLQFLIIEAGVQKSVLKQYDTEKPLERETVKFTNELFKKQKLMEGLSKTLPVNEDKPKPKRKI
jgi:hypothetical protein